MALMIHLLKYLVILKVAKVIFYHGIALHQQARRIVHEYAL